MSEVLIYSKMPMPMTKTKKCAKKVPMPMKKILKSNSDEEKIDKKKIPMPMSKLQKNSTPFI